MGGKGEGEPQKRYPKGTEIVTDENGRRIVILPQIGNSRISMDSRNIRGKLTKGQKYVRNDGHTSS